MSEQNSLMHDNTRRDRKPRKKNGGAGVLLVIIVLLVLAAAAAVCYFTIHLWTPATCTEPAECRICGITKGRVTGHDWKEPNCTYGQVCRDCGKERGEPLEHEWTVPTCQKPSTCTLCGKENGDPLPHNFVDATYNDPGICVDCGAEDGSPKIPSSPRSLRDVISKSRSSSAYGGDDLGTHGSYNLYDGKLGTNWTENAPGDGIGEHVTFYLKDTYAVKTMRIYIGSHYNRETYEHNGRPKVLTLTFSDGSSEQITLEDTYDEQIITLERYHYTDSVKITIKDVYTGTLFPDTIIAEVDFDFYKP